MNGRRLQEIKILSVGVFFTIKSKMIEVMSIKPDLWPKATHKYMAKILEKLSPAMTNMASIKLLLQIAVQYDLLIHHMDVKSAYLNASLDYEIYVEPPEGFESKNGNHVGKLKKSLNGLKQSSRTWNRTFHINLATQNFMQSSVDPSMYIQNVHNQISIILLWVDIILIASKTEADLMKIKTKLNSRFKMTDFGKLSWFLGIQFECKNSTTKMNQSRYIEKILSKFGKADCKPCSTPCEMDIKKTSDEVDLIDSKPHREIIVSLIYIYI